MHRRTLLGGASILVTAGVWGGGALRAGAATGLTAVPGWAKTARLSAGATSGDGTTLAIGHYLTPDGLGPAYLRRLVDQRWSPLPQPKVPTVWGAAGAAPHGVWIAGVRGEVSLPDPDGTVDVGLLDAAGHYRAVGTSSLPRYLILGSIHQYGDELVISGAQPIDDGQSLAPFAARRSLTTAGAAWRVDTIRARTWSDQYDFPALKTFGPTGRWGVAANRLLTRSGRRWTDVTPPKPAGDDVFALRDGVALAAGLLILVETASGAGQLYRQGSSGWTRLSTPPGFSGGGLVARGNTVWAVGSRLTGGSYQAVSIKLVDGQVRQVRTGPRGSVLEDAFAVGANAPIGYGILDPDPDSNEPHNSDGWTVRLG